MILATRDQENASIPLEVSTGNQQRVVAASNQED
jgi:hypothetical protein